LAWKLLFPEITTEPRGRGSIQKT